MWQNYSKCSEVNFYDRDRGSKVIGRSHFQIQNYSILIDFYKALTPDPCHKNWPRSILNTFATFSRQFPTRFHANMRDFIENDDLLGGLPARIKNQVIVHHSRWSCCAVRLCHSAFLRGMLRIHDIFPFVSNNTRTWDPTNPGRECRTTKMSDVKNAEFRLHPETAEPVTSGDSSYIFRLSSQIRGKSRPDEVGIIMTQVKRWSLT